MHEFLSKINRTLIRIKSIILDSNFSVFSKLFLFLKLKYKRGFNFVEFHDFEFDKANKEFIDSFLNAKEQQFYLKLLNPRKYFCLARNKYLTHVLLDTLGITNKSTLFCYYNPEMRVTNDSVISYDIISTLNILKSKSIEQCVIKTTESSHGDNVWVIKEIEYLNNDAKLIRFDNEIILLSSLLNKEPIIFESLIVQTKQFSNFNSTSVNTVRFMTTLLPNGCSKIIACWIKIGRNGKCVDNAGAGGNIDACVDIETGKIYYTNLFSGWRRTKDIIYHPDSNNQIEGVVIENWNSIKEQVLKYQQCLPFVKAAGWDIAITDQGAFIVEINDMWDRTGQLFIRKGWKQEIQECYNAWYKYYKNNNNEKN